MGQEDKGRPVLHRHPVKKGVPFLARAGLQRELARLRQGRDTHGLDFTPQVMLLRQPSDKRRILIGLAAAQAVVHMADDEPLPPLRQEEVQKDDRIPPARDTNEGRRGGIEGMRNEGSQAAPLGSSSCPFRARLRFTRSAPSRSAAGALRGSGCCRLRAGTSRRGRRRAARARCRTR